MQRRDMIFGSILATLSSSLQLRAASLSLASLAEAGSLPIRGVSVEVPISVIDSQGDTWAPTWAKDGHIYSPSNDTGGFHSAAKSNIAFNRIDENDAVHLSGTTINPMSQYGKEAEKGPDGCTWKSSGCACIDGVLYWVVARHHYGDDSGDPYRRQTAQNASIIKSVDYGRTWTRSAAQNYDAPMFPGRRFATPYFVEFGRDGAAPSNVGDCVYALSNNGFWDCGDDMIVGRVKRSRIGRLEGADWQFYTGGDGGPASWARNMNDAKPVLNDSRKFGMTGATYMPRYRRYMMIGWYYPAGGGKMAGAATHTVWDFYESPRPWGPWTKIGSYDSQPSGYYSPQVCPKFQTSDKVFAFTAGNWNQPKDYRLTVVPVKLQL